MIFRDTKRRDVTLAMLTRRSRWVIRSQKVLVSLYLSHSFAYIVVNEQVHLYYINEIIYSEI